MRQLYSVCVGIYFFAIRVAQFFSKKARLMIDGRRNWRNVLSQKILSADYVWVHCASLGEFEQGRPIIEKFHNAGQKVILTFFSPSGYEVRKDYACADIVCYLPFDSRRNAKDFVEIVKPKLAIFVKYEFWGNTLFELKSHNIPVYLISGIFRKNQMFFKPCGGFYRKILSCFKHFYVQDDNSVDLLKGIGFDCVSVCGDTRVDRVCQIVKEDFSDEVLESFSCNSKVLVCGSTWLPDEKILIRYIRDNDDVKIILVPHEIHEEHLAAIEKLTGSLSVRYSQSKDANIDDKRIIIVDTIGMLSKIYRYGQIAYIGGGFGRGIHNTLEAAVYGIPVIFGPNYLKFREAHELIALGAGFSINTYEDLVSRIDNLSNIDAYSLACEATKEYFLKSMGATDFIYNTITK